MGKQTTPDKKDDPKDIKQDTTDVNSVAQPSLADRARYATGNFAGKQVRNVLDALNRNR